MTKPPHRRAAEDWRARTRSPRTRRPPRGPGRMAFRLLLPALLAGCGSPTLDLSGYPDKARERLYSEGRLGGEAGLADFDLRKAWRAAFDRSP